MFGGLNHGVLPNGDAFVVWGAVDGSDNKDTAIWSATYSMNEGWTDAAPALQTGYLYNVTPELFLTDEGQGVMRWQSGFNSELDLLNYDLDTGLGAPERVAAGSVDRIQRMHVSSRGYAAITTSVYNVNLYTYGPTTGWGERLEIRKGSGQEMKLLPRPAALNTGETLIAWVEKKGYHEVDGGDVINCVASFSELWVATIGTDGSIEETRLSLDNGIPDDADFVACDGR